MDDLKDSPSASEVSNPQNMWMHSTNDRKHILKSVCEKVVDRFILFQFNTAEGKLNEDRIQQYGKNFLSLGCFYLEYCDAIQEGDGERVLRCWRYLLPIFVSSGRKNYSIEALNVLYQYQYKFNPRQSARLIWNRFINVHGLRGRNIPCDLHLEHLNRTCKNAIRQLCVNKTDSAIVKTGKALGTIHPTLHQFDDQNNVRDIIGTHRAPTSEKDISTITRHLQQSKIFSTTTCKRAHGQFPNPRNVLHAKNSTEVCKWIVDHIH